MYKKLISLTVIFTLAIVANAFVFCPQTMTVKRGKVESGNMSSLFSSDNSRLVVRNGAKASIYDSPVDIESQVVCGQANPSSMKLRIESMASTSGLVEYVEMFNWTTNQYQEVFHGPISRTEGLLIVDVQNSGRFTGSGGQMKVRYWVDNRGLVAASTWTVAIDELTWDVEF